MPIKYFMIAKPTNPSQKFRCFLVYLIDIEIIGTFTWDNCVKWLSLSLPEPKKGECVWECVCMQNSSAHQICNSYFCQRVKRSCFNSGGKNRQTLSDTGSGIGGKYFERFKRFNFGGFGANESWIVWIIQQMNGWKEKRQIFLVFFKMQIIHVSFVWMHVLFRCNEWS